MYRFYINKVKNDYHYSEMARVFLNDDEFEVIAIDFQNAGDIVLSEGSYMINASCSDQRNDIKSELYLLLSELTGKESEWGIHTGVRPLKLAHDLYDECKSIDKVMSELKEIYLFSDKKIQLIKELLTYQLQYVQVCDDSFSSIYIGIPFCPTRCAYCSFASNIAEADEIEKYLVNLLKEIQYTGELVKSHNTQIESIYVGGGTPTTLNANQLERLINAVNESFGIDPKDIEFTIEAGRPDTITADKLAVMRNKDINRISINPQTMKDETLRTIGRDHTAEAIRNGYKLASDYNFDVINADLIVGLPNETLDDFQRSLDEIINIGANNITIHTLSIKKGSRLKEEDPAYYRQGAVLVASMLDYAHQRLLGCGFSPYYMYRQKHQIGSFENIGYCKPGKHSLYNIRIMEEKQTIIALGAGAIGKVYYPDTKSLKRIPNVSNYKIYSERFDEMLKRKDMYYGG